MTPPPNVDLKKHMDRVDIVIPEEPPDCVLVVDTREKKPYKFLRPSIKRSLATGDYSVRGYEEDMIVERKSLPDLVKCVGSDRERFMDQVKRMQLFKHRMLMIECAWIEIDAGGWRSHRVTPNHVNGTLCAIASMGVPFVVAGCRERATALTERFLVGCHRREWLYMRRKLIGHSGH